MITFTSAVDANSGEPVPSCRVRSLVLRIAGIIALRVFLTRELAVL